MGWQDRSYSRGPESGGIGPFIHRLIFGSFSLGTWFDIHVRVHSMLILMIVFNLLTAGGGAGIKNAVIGSLILFAIVLLHEFGHCIAARRVGGVANDILLWPLGGLAFVDTPRRPWPSFVATAGGPLVNLLICAVCAGALWMIHGTTAALPINPLLVFNDTALINDNSFSYTSASTLAYYLWWIDSVSWTLLCFNLLPIFPLDGGRVFQTMLWPKLGHSRSMDIACTVGIAGAIVMGIVGFLNTEWLLLILAISGYMTCRQTRLMLRDNGDSGWAEPAYSGGNNSSRVRRQQRPFGPNPLRARRVVPLDDKRTLRDLNPLEWIARRKRKKQFERLMRDD